MMSGWMTETVLHHVALAFRVAQQRKCVLYVVSGWPEGGSDAGSFRNETYPW